MPCYSPITAFLCASGEVVFVERLRRDVIRELQLPCAQCIGCRLERSRQWAMRCMHEASMHEENAFVTLTYNPENVPKDGSLEYRDFQLFMKRLRKEIAPKRARFYACGEYGPELMRPHFHACLFGMDFYDKEYWSTTSSGAHIYRSEQLERLWPYGFCSVGDVTFESAAYAARYCVQKVTGKNAEYWYRRGDIMLRPEFNTMSRKPGIGTSWLKKWKTDVYPHDYVVVNGRKVKPPKFYDKIFKGEEPDVYEELQWKRELSGRSHYEDNVPARLLVKEQVAKAKAGMLKRKLDDF